MNDRSCLLIDSCILGFFVEAARESTLSDRVGHRHATQIVQIQRERLRLSLLGDRREQEEVVFYIEDTSGNEKKNK